MNPITVQVTPALTFTIHHKLMAALMPTLRELQATGIRHVGMTEREAYQILKDAREGRR